VDDRVSLRGAATQRGVICQIAAPRLRAGGLDGLGRGVGAGEREDGVAVVDQLSDDGGTDQTGTTGDEDVHGGCSLVTELVSHHRSSVMRHKSRHVV
jgi:hypothetical protein